MATSARPIGDLLREWRQRRRLSQLELACEADISTRHLSFLETGRSSPSRDMVLHLAERLNVPLRERNALLVAAGYAPAFSERTLDDPALETARRAIDMVLAGHEPYPAIAVDRHWTLLASNEASRTLVEGGDPVLLEPPVNVLRFSLHPRGMAPRILNLPEWRAHVLARLRHQCETTADPVLAELMREISEYPVAGGAISEKANSEQEPGVVLPLEIATPNGSLRFFSTTTIFGTPMDITLAEIALESFFPADGQTAEALRRLSERRAESGR